MNFSIWLPVGIAFLFSVTKNRLWKRFTKKISWHTEVHRYWCKFWCHIWWSLKTLKMSIESIFDQFWWPSYVMSKLMSISVNLMMSIYFFVNLLHSIIVWHLTSFWKFDIFWHFDTYNLNHHSPLQDYFSYFIGLLVAISLDILIEDVLSFEMSGVTSKSDKN